MRLQIFFQEFSDLQMVGTEHQIVEIEFAYGFKLFAKICSKWFQ